MRMFYYSGGRGLLGLRAARETPLIPSVNTKYPAGRLGATPATDLCTFVDNNNHSFCYRVVKREQDFAILPFLARPHLCEAVQQTRRTPVIETFRGLYRLSSVERDLVRGSNAFQMTEVSNNLTSVVNVQEHSKYTPTEPPVIIRTIKDISHSKPPKWNQMYQNLRDLRFFVVLPSKLGVIRTLFHIQNLPNGIK